MAAHSDLRFPCRIAFSDSEPPASLSQGPCDSPGPTWLIWNDHPISRSLIIHICKVLFIMESHLFPGSGIRMWTSLGSPARSIRKGRFWSALDRGDRVAWTVGPPLTLNTESFPLILHRWRQHFSTSALHPRPHVSRDSWSQEPGLPHPAHLGGGRAQATG